MNQVAKHIIACKISGVDNYVFSVRREAHKKLKPLLTRDVEKAIRFYDEKEANDFISKFSPLPRRNYTVETFAPAARSLQNTLR